MSAADVVGLEALTGHRFKDRRLAERALTHSSMEVDDRRHTYERLEFLGDRVLGLVVAEMLLQSHPEAEEGEIAKRHARLVSRSTCAAVARNTGLDRLVRLGSSEEKGGGRNKTSILADVTESVIAALYRDGGLPAATSFVSEHWKPQIEHFEGPLRDAKTELQEWSHAKGFSTPTYHEMGRSGPDHRPMFEVRVEIEGMEGAVGRGGSKRDAEHAAAEAVLDREQVDRQRG